MSINLASIYKTAGKRYWMCRFTQKRGGRPIRLSTGHTSKARARRFSSKIEDLVDAWRCGRPHPPELSDWIGSLSDRTAQKLAGLGMIDLTIRQSKRPLSDHLADWHKSVLARGNNTQEHARRYLRYLQSLASELGWLFYDDIQTDPVLGVLHDRGLAPATRSRYILALEDFCRWMVSRGRARTELVFGVKKPRAVPGWDRRPLEYAEFQRLADYLRSCPPYYDGQNTSERWTAYDRLMIYWTAVSTAYRKSELRSLRVHHLSLSGRIGCIDLDARSAKNRSPGAVPIPTNLTQALSRYTHGKHPNTPVFWITSGKNQCKTVKGPGGKTRRVYDRAGGAKAALHRDLRAAGLGCVLESDKVVDFHSLRATAITWWLEGHTPAGVKISPERVRRLARLSSLSMVQRYVRGSYQDDVSWLEPCPQRERPTTQTG